MNVYTRSTNLRLGERPFLNSNTKLGSSRASRPKVVGRIPVVTR